ncbi:MAG: Rdx family protein [Actinomycetota bacterium]
MGAISDLIRDYQHVVDDLTLVMGEKGVFNVEVDGQLLFSKHAVKRFPESGELLQLFKNFVGADVPRYDR